jgi:predicted ATP-binding protein involved in virulence
MTNTSKTSSTARPKLSDQQMREFIARVKKETEELVNDGVDRNDLQKRLEALEAALSKNAPNDVKSQALDDLEATLLPASDGGMTRDVLNFFNQMLGTGMPPV